MKMITGLTKANIRGTGIELSPEHDFTDDGNRFRGFIYKGMPMTQCRADGTCYLTIRVDYLKNSFTWKEWSKTEEYKLEDEFNGVSQFNLDKLIENLEAVITKVNEMNAAAEAEEIDMSEVIAKADAELEDLEKFIEDVKVNLKWWELKSWQLSGAANYIKALINRINNKIDFNALSRKEKKSYVEKLENNGYVTIPSNDYYIEQLKKFMSEEVK